MKIIKPIFLGAVLLHSAVNLNAQSGGDFTIAKSVIATGGGTSAGGAFGISGTSGQATAGANQTTAPFSLVSGFWASAPLAPTAARVSVGGKVLTANGAGIRNVFVTLTDARGALRATYTGSFGMYRFDDVEIGETYILTVNAKKYVFANPSQIVSVNEELTNLDFVAEPF